MTRAAIFSFSARGAALAERIAEFFEARGDRAALYAPKGNLGALTQEAFAASDALIYVGACGIAVRAVAPHLVSKTTDPAVLVVDDRGQFVISLLSGHIGGANELARGLADHLGAMPVVTTATDVNRRFSADDWAARHGLIISDMGAAKRFSAGILTADMPFVSDFPIEGALPAGLRPGADGPCGLFISCRVDTPFPDTLTLTPRILHLGIGCKRGVSADQVARAVDAALAGARLNPGAVVAVASIDRKSDEAGLLAFAASRGLPIRFYSADELNALPGEFTASDFVRQTVGVDCVCERAAVRDAMDGARLIVKKTSLDGVTVAVAQEKWSVRF